MAYTFPIFVVFSPGLWPPGQSDSRSASLHTDLALLEAGQVHFHLIDALGFPHASLYHVPGILAIKAEQGSA